MTPVRVVIADDDPLTRTLFQRLVEQHERLELVGAAEDAEGAISVTSTERPDVVVLDWVMPGGGGPAAARAIRAQSPATKIVALTSSDTAEAELDMLRAGADAFVLKGGAPGDLAREILAAADRR